MKRRFFISITLLIVFAFLIISGCATTPRLAEPTHPESTMLIGRIKVICTGFPNSFSANGEHTDGVIVDLKDVSSNEIHSLIARGAGGFFHLMDPGGNRYTIVQIKLVVRGSAQTSFNLHQITSDSFQIEKNAVNNLGDVVLRCNYVSKSIPKYYKRHQFIDREYTEIEGASSLEYKGNYDEVKAWFGKTYPESVWTGENWENAQIVRGDNEELHIMYWVRPNLLM